MPSQLENAIFSLLLGLLSAAVAEQTEPVAVAVGDPDASAADSQVRTRSRARFFCALRA